MVYCSIVVITLKYYKQTFKASFRILDVKCSFIYVHPLAFLLINIHVMMTCVAAKVDDPSLCDKSPRTKA
jgi:hypothetical protein